MRFNHLKRREFIALFGGAATAWPLAVRAQQPAMPVIGFLHPGKPDGYTRVVAGLREGLKEAGFVEGQNMVIEFRWANDHVERLPALAADLVRNQVAAIVAGGGAASALAAKAATSTIPIILPFGADPIKLGLVASLNRPGGNVTGVTFITTELTGKRLELLCEAVPQAAMIAFLTDPRDPTAEEQGSDIVAAARALGRQMIVLEARSDRDFEAAFATLIERRAGALVIGSYPLFTSNRAKLLGLEARHKIPAIHHYREFAVDGGLMSYGASFADAFRLGGVYVGQILKGAKPADLPFQQSAKFELVINLKTAKALGLKIPITLQVAADEVIE
jgi:putative tryptophan/tyrosine transport system substrate-binding protein